MDSTRSLNLLLGNLIELRERIDEPPPRIESWNPITRHRQHKELEQWVKARKPSAGITAEHLEKKYPEDPDVTRSVRRGGIIGGGIGATGFGGMTALRTRRLPTRLRLIRSGISAAIGGFSGTTIGRQVGWIRKHPGEFTEAVGTLKSALGGKDIVPAESLPTTVPRASSYREVTRELKKQGVGPIARHHTAIQTRPLVWSGENAAFAPQGEKGLIITAKKVHPLVFRHEAGHGKDYAHYGGEQGFQKAYPKYGQVFTSRKERISSTLLAEHRAWAHAKPRTKKEREIQDAALTTYRAAMGLSALLDELIEFEDKPRNRFGTIAKDALIGGATSAVGTAGLLAGAGMLLKRRAPDLAGMLRTAAGQHVKVFNPMHTIPMMRSLPEASRLFGKQLRAVKEVEHLATSARKPTIGTLKAAYQRSGINPAREAGDISKFKKTWSRTPGETMEKSVGLLSGMAATGVGVGGGAALSGGWQQRKKKELQSLLDDLIEFKLYQPGREDRPPEELPEFPVGKLADYVVQEHHAKRAGRHLDIRIGDKRGMYSWATKKDIEGALPPGKVIQIHPQPIHPHSYNEWEGEIKSGYGAGTVKTRHLGKALITKSTPTEIHATLANRREHHRMAFLKTPRGWLLTRGKHPEAPREASKPKYKSVSPEKAHEHLQSIEPGTIVQPKIDGALVYVTTKGNRPEIFSHRVSKQSGKHIIHTERFFKGRPTTDIPKEHQRTLIAELYGTRKGKAVPPQELGGILNTHLGESIGKQKKKGIKLRIMPFDYANGKGESYPERLAKVKETVRHLPKDQFHTPEEAHTPGAARRLFNKIKNLKHPLTSEGVIVHPPHGKMVKIKNVEEANVKITGTFPGEGKFKGSHGGITYEGGRVGTGFTDETRRELHKHVGRTARIRHQGQYPSGAYRAPSFIAIEENK